MKKPFSNLLTIAWAVLCLILALTAIRANAQSGLCFSVPGENSYAAGNTHVMQADFDNDGIPDLASVGSGSVFVQLGNGDGTFDAAVSHTAGSGPFFIAVGDFDGDNNVDLAVVNNISSDVSILLGDGTGDFDDAVGYGVGTGPRGIVTGDYNGDGDPDLAAVSSVTSRLVSVLIGNGDGTFDAVVNYTTSSSFLRSITQMDVNGDDKLDLVAGGTGGIFVFLGVGDGTFPTTPINVASTTGYTIRFVVAGDFDNDGDDDIAFSETSGYVRVLNSHDGGDLTPDDPVLVGSNYAVPFMTVVDFDKDGDLDIAGVYTSPNSGVTLLFGAGGNSFQAAINNDFLGSTLATLAIADTNDDDNHDVIASGNVASIIGVTILNGTGERSPAFTAPVGKVSTGFAWSLATGDLNNDSHVDLVVPSGSGVGIYEGYSTGGFISRASKSAGTNPRTAAVADFNNDGYPDIAVANNGGSDVSVLIGNGTFTGFATAVTYTVGTAPAWITTAYLNYDLNIDIITANAGSDNVSVLLGVGDGTFQTVNNYAVGTGPFYVTAADMDNDGMPDLVVANQNSSNISFLKGNMLTGTFEGAVHSATLNGGPSSVAVSDFDQDGTRDVVAAVGGSVAFMPGNGDGTFGEVITSSLGSDFGVDVTVGRFNAADAKDDIAVTVSGATVVMTGDGEGNFIVSNVLAGSDQTAFSIHSADINSDAIPDLLSPSNFDGMLSVYLNTRAAIYFETPLNFCAGGSVTLSGNSTAGSWLWSNGATTREIVVDVSGQYSLTTTNLAGTCSSSTALLTVNAIAYVEPEASVNNPTCEVSTGSITIWGQIGDGSEEFSFDGGNTWQSGNHKTNLPPQSEYSIKIRTTHGDCPSPAKSITIGAIPSPPAAPSFAVVQPTCIVETGTMTLTPQSGNPEDYYYSFDNGDTFGYYWLDQNIKGELAPGDYNVLVYNAVTGCQSPSVIASVNEQPTDMPPAPQVTVTHPSHCINYGMITFEEENADEKHGYYGDDPTYFTDYEALYNSPGDYSVVTQDNRGCISPPTSVTINPVPSDPLSVADVEVTDPTCTVSSGTLTVVVQREDDTYSFDNGDTFQAENFKVLEGGSVYGVIVKTTAGCTSGPNYIYLNTQPNFPAAPEIEVEQPNCTTPTGNIWVYGDFYEISYDNGATFLSSWDHWFNFDMEPGEYIVLVSRGGDCITESESFTINPQPRVPDNPEITLTHPTCEVKSGSLEVAIQEATDTYSFDGGVSFQSENFKSVVEVGRLHLVMIKSVEGCSSTDFAYIGPVLPIPDLPEFDVIQPSCEEQYAIVAIDVAGSHSYSIDESNFYYEREDWKIFSAGNHEVIVQNEYGCENRNSFTTGPVPLVPPAFQTEITQPSCTTPTGNIIIQEQPNVVYSFNGGEDYQINNSKSGLTSGTYTIVLRSSDGCTTQGTRTINAQPYVPSVPTATVLQPTCSVATGSITVGSQINATYSFDNGVSFQTANGKSNLVAGTYMVVLRSTVSGNCKSQSGSFVVNEQPVTPSTPVATVLQPTCTTPTGTITVASSSNVSYSFNNGGNFQVANVQAGLPSGTYVVVVKSNNSCTASASFVINAQPPSPTVPVAAVLQPTCTTATGTITITTQSGVTYSFNGGTTYQSDNIKSGLAAGDYSIFLKNGEGCTSSKSFTVQPQPPVPIKPIITLTGVNTDAPLLTSSEASAYQWYLNEAAISGATGRTHTITAAGAYTVITFSSGGCSSVVSDKQVILVTGLGDNIVPVTLQLHPNPASAWLTVSLPESIDDKSVSIFNLNGVMIDRQQPVGNEARFYVAEYASATYLVRIQIKNFVHIARFIKN